MANEIDVAELARTLAEIASTTSDTGTAIRLLELTRALLESAGLEDVSPDDAG
jgi:hypothetical protein